MTDEEVRRFAFAGPSSPAAVDFRNLPNEPRNPAAESATLGALMLSKACADALLPVLQTEHFTSRPHQDTLEAIRAVHASGRPVDPILVNDQLRRAGRVAWGSVKAATFIHACMEATYFPGHGSSYAATVIECAARRRVLQAGIRIAQAAARGTGELPDLMRLVASEIHAVADEVTAHEGVRRPQRQPIRLAAAINEAIPKLASTQQRAIDDVSL
jgi:replicative DNA helicase